MTNTQNIEYLGQIIQIELIKEAGVNLYGKNCDDGIQAYSDCVWSIQILTNQDC